MQSQLTCRFLLSLFAILGLTFGALAQDFSKIDAHARSTRFPKNQDVQALALALTKDCSTEKEKVRAFYVWIADNIKYDVKSFENRKDIDPQKSLDYQQPQTVLSRKKAVCAGYSNLFDALCKAAQIKNINIEGQVKNNQGRVMRTGHAWNLVRADGQWGLVDATWGSGYVDTDAGKYTEHFTEKFFFSAPESLIADHLPHDPLFQLLPNPLTFEEFKQNTAEAKATLVKKMSGEPAEGYASLKDSLNTFAEMDPEKSNFYSSSRILRLNPGSNVGILGLAEYHFGVGARVYKEYAEAWNTIAGTKKQPSAQWFDSQADRLETVEKSMTECLEMLSQSTQNDAFSPRIRNAQRNAKNILASCQKNMKTDKQHAARLKK